MKPLCPSTETMHSAIRDDRISTLLRLAKEAESIEANDWTTRGKVDAFFTCTKVSWELGNAFADEYEKLFVESEEDLWNDQDCMSRRILSLCFMAAMVEAGDA